MVKQARTILYTQQEFDNLNSDHKSKLKKRHPELLINVKYSYHKQIHNVGDPIMYIVKSELENTQPRFSHISIANIFDKILSLATQVNTLTEMNKQIINELATLKTSKSIKKEIKFSEARELEFDKSAPILKSCIKEKKHKLKD